MFERFAQFGVTFLQFLKQADIFNRDDGLGSEGLKQFNLRRGKGAHHHVPSGLFHYRQCRADTWPTFSSVTRTKTSLMPRVYLNSLMQMDSAFGGTES